MNWKVPRSRQSRQIDVPLEAEEQVKVVTYARNRGLLIFSVPNGGKRGLMEAIRLKQQGTASGIPDLILPMARKGYHSLYIELKREKGGVVSEAQQYWLETLNREGMLAIVCRGADEAIEAINNYFSLHDISK